MSSIEDSNFNLFKSLSYQIHEEKKGNNFENGNPKQSSESEINQYQKEISRYERKISYPDANNDYKGKANYHFEFLGTLNVSPEKKQISEKKRKNDINISNISIFRRKIESNSLYVGFENKYGQNTCYINVVLHFLYFFPCINEYLIKLYKTNKDNINISNSNIANINNFDFFLFLLGKTLFEYQNALSNLDNKGITILHTTELRQYLDIISNNIYQFNKVADPVELLSFLINIINKNNQNEVHKYFFINLVEENQCTFCQQKTSKKYDKDNFIYHIYVDEIINYIRQNKMLFNNYNHKLFIFSQLITMNYSDNCKKCQNKVKKALKCNGPDFPIFLLINCIWNNPRQTLKNIIKFLYILPLEDCLENLFCCENQKNKQRIVYNLLGMILYSPALSHYINVMFNIQKNIFVIYDDDKIKELNSIHEVYKEIILEQIKKNPNAYFYPVLLIYYKEILYDDLNTIQNNIYTFQKYSFLIDECKRVQKENEVILTDEQKKQNYLELVKAQMKYEQNNNNHFFNDNDNLGCSSFYQVKEKKDDENENSSNKSFKMAIDEESNHSINHINNYFNNSNNKLINTNINNINKDNNINNNMNIETQEIDNKSIINIKKSKTNNFNDNIMNFNKEYKTNLYNNVNNNFNGNIYYDLKNYPSEKSIPQFKNINNNNGLFFESIQGEDVKLNR